MRSSILTIRAIIWIGSFLLHTGTAVFFYTIPFTQNKEVYTVVQKLPPINVRPYIAPDPGSGEKSKQEKDLEIEKIKGKDVEISEEIEIAEQLEELQIIQKPKERIEVFTWKFAGAVQFPKKISPPEKPKESEKASFESTVISPPKITDNQPPGYPRLARRLGYEGLVTLQVTVSVYGSPTKVEIIKSSGHGILDRAAVSAVEGWRFAPGKKGNTPVKSIVTIPIRFILKK